MKIIIVKEKSKFSENGTDFSRKRFVNTNMVLDVIEVYALIPNPFIMIPFKMQNYSFLLHHTCIRRRGQKKYKQNATIYYLTIYVCIMRNAKFVEF